MPERFQPRSPEELERQVETAEETLEARSVLLPPSKSRADLLAMSSEELRAAYPVRYQAYLDAVRRKAPEASGEELPFFRADREQLLGYLQILNGLDTYAWEHHERTEESQEATLRGKQFTVFEDISRHLEAGDTDGYVTLPTGFGKTVIFSQVVEATRVPTVIVVPTKQLVDQTYDRFTEFAPKVEAGRVYSRAKERDAKAIVTTYASLVGDIKEKRIDPAAVKMLILDEAHLALSEKRMEAVRTFTNAVKIGFTATPEYNEQKKVEQLLPVEYHHMETREAIEEGYLAPCRSIIVKTHANIKNVAVDRGDYIRKQLEVAVNIASRNMAAVELYKQAYSGRGAIAFCVGIKHAEAVARSFTEQGINAVVVSGDTPDKELERILEGFESGKIDVVSNADLLISGFDSTRASVCLNLDPTMSLVRSQQRAGRVLRLNEKDPEKWGVVVDFLDEHAERKNPVLYSQILEGAAVAPPARAAEHVFSETGQRSGPADSLSQVSLEGMEVIWEEERVIEVSREVQDANEKEVFLSFAEFKSEVRNWAEDIRSKGQEPGWGLYFSIYKSHPGWPSHPDKFYKSSGWVGFDDLVARESITVLPFGVFGSEIKVWVDELKKGGLKPSKQLYQDVYKEHPGWPSNPYIIYKDSGWSGFDDLFSREKRVELPFEVFESEIKVWTDELRKNGLKPTAKLYIDVYKEHPGWPAHPDRNYKDHDWIWFEPKTPTFDVFKDEISLWIDQLRNSGRTPSRGLYLEERKNRPEWPPRPDTTYKKSGWQGWDELFGKEPK